MGKFQILCVTMHQKDFSKIKEMNIHSDVIFANQSDHTSMDNYDFEGHHAQMITTETRGVGINRNLALLYASGDICLFADDDLVYRDNVEEIVLNEFDKFPDADVIIFNVNVIGKARKQKKYDITRKCTPWERMPWGAIRVAVRLSSVRKVNIWYSTLFGGGGVFPSGEDSLWLNDARKKGLTFYVSKETICDVSFEKSTWFTGYDERFFYGKGAYYQITHPKSCYLWMIYMALRTSKMGTMPFKQKWKWMQYGRHGFNGLIPYEQYSECENS